MSRKALQLGFCFLALAALAAFNAPETQAFDFSYTQSGVSNTMAKACNQAIQRIKDRCDIHGAITTAPRGCDPLYDLYGNYAGQICRCEATAAYCGIQNPNF